MNIRFALISTIFAAALAGCGGGGGSSTPSPASSASPAPAQSVTDPITTSGQTAGTPFTLSGIPSADLTTLGLTSAPTVTLPIGVDGNGSAALTSTPPAAVTEFAHAGRLVLAKRSPKANTISAATTLFYFVYTPTTSIVVNANATSASSGMPYNLTFTPTNPQSGLIYHVAAFDGTTWTADTQGAGLLSSSTGTVNISGTLNPAIVLLGGTTYAIAVYAVPASLDTSSGTLSFCGDGCNGSVNGLNYFTNQISVNTPSTVQSGDTSGASYVVSESLPVGASNGPTGTGVNSVVNYGVITPNSNISFAKGGQFGATFANIPNNLPNGQYSVAVSADGINWLTGIGTATVASGNETLTYAASAAITLTSATPYYIAVYE